MSVESLCIHTVTIQRNAPTADRKGGMPDNWTDLHVGVKARIRPASASERAQWGGLPTVASHIVYFHDATLGILEKDEIVYGARRFNVLGVRDVDEWGRYLIVTAEEIR